MFIDETWASTKMARTHGRVPKRRRLRMSVPHGHWKTTTFVAGIRTTGLVAPFVLDGPINRDAFEVYVDKVLAPDLKPGDVVIMDNLSSHKGPRVREMIEAAGASLIYSRPTAPTSTPSKRRSRSSRPFSEKLPSAPSKASGTTIGQLLDAFTPTDCANYFAACGYDAT